MYEVIFNIFLKKYLKKYKYHFVCSLHTPFYIFNNGFKDEIICFAFILLVKCFNISIIITLLSNDIISYLNIMSNLLVSKWTMVALLNNKIICNFPCWIFNMLILQMRRIQDYDSPMVSACPV